MVHLVPTSPHQVGGAVEQERPGKDRAASEAIGEKPTADGTDEKSGEQRCQESRYAGHAEQADCGRRQNTALDDSWRDIAGIEQIVQLEEKAETK
jgi:hypothetical protein